MAQASQSDAKPVPGPAVSRVPMPPAVPQANPRVEGSKPAVSLRPAPLWTAFARGIALFAAVFSFINAYAQANSGGDFNANLWWIDFRPLPGLLQRAALLVVSVVLMAFALVPPVSWWRRRLTATVVELLWLILAWNTVQFFARLYHGSIKTPFPVPLTLLVAVFLFPVWRAANTACTSRSPLVIWPIILGTFVLAIGLVPVLEMLCFGLTDYSPAAGEADAIVVLGAAVQADGSPSQALRDRVDTAVQLYLDQRQKFPGHENLKFIVSGGKGSDETVNEADVMKALAVKAGVGESDITVDRDGINTSATVANTTQLFVEMVKRWVDTNRFTPEHSEPITLVVSHFYHLPRVQMAFALNQWHRVYTVPVRKPLVDLLKFMAREDAALWWHYTDMLRGSKK